MSIALKLILFLGLVGISCSFYLIRRSVSPTTFLDAKKRKSSPGKGFGKVPIVAEEAIPKVDSQSEVKLPKVSDDQNNVNPTTSADVIFKKYGVATETTTQAVTANTNEEPKFGVSIISKMSPSAQQKIDQTLLSATFASLGFVIICGVAISLDAFKIVFPDVAVPSFLDSLISDFLSPSFTPSLGVFFFFSINYGLFKFAQISSSETVYKE